MALYPPLSFIKSTLVMQTSKMVAKNQKSKSSGVSKSNSIFWVATYHANISPSELLLK